MFSHGHLIHSEGTAMQIDFHFATTYVLSRLAGFTRAEANTVATSAQYVDDATNAGRIRFSNGASYSRICSAHKMLDYQNFQDLANSEVWIPFHFLPGNDRTGSGGAAEPADYYRRLVCRPNSPVAQEMVRHCVNDHASAHALHRLGITMHVYADTWAHQGFVGVIHPINHVNDLEDDDENERDSSKFATRLATFFGDAFDSVASRFVDQVPLGHGAALSHPDLPFLTWRYKNGLNEVVERNNPEDFLAAAVHLFEALVAFRRARGDRNNPSELRTDDLKRIADNFTEIRSRDGEERLKRWTECIARGDFSFGAETISYIAKKRGSWKYAALGNAEDKETINAGYTWNEAFLTADWKLFHDAIQVHRQTVLREVLPSFGICAA
jgi:hypothetical protein